MSGRVLDLSNVDQTFRDRFWSKVDIGGPDECWEWTAHRQRAGYGEFTVAKGEFHTASRVSLALSIGALPVGMSACHSCDNPPCCNPAHLFLGTPADNTNDCIRKGRGNRARGEDTFSARLTEEIVRGIRSRVPMRYGEMSELAREHGVSLNTIAAVVRGKKWGHVS